MACPGSCHVQAKHRNGYFRFDVKLREFQQRSRDFEADSLQICSKTNLFGLLQATPPLEDQHPNLRQNHPGATDSRSQPEHHDQRASSLCLCREPEGAGAGGGEAPFRGPIQGMWSREVFKGGGGRDCLRRGPRIDWLCVSCFPWGWIWQGTRAANRHHREAFSV